MTDFIPFPKIPRWSRNIVITEKLDGTNAAIVIKAMPTAFPPPLGYTGLLSKDGTWYAFWAQSRTRFITPQNDNYGFAGWVSRNLDCLLGLGEGVHYGEWWGQGIQRKYGQNEKRFSLFNTHRWSDDNVRPACCSVVPVLYEGPNEEAMINGCMTALKVRGSIAAPGFDNPEGIMIYHTAAQQYFKRTFEHDENGKEAA